MQNDEQQREEEGDYINKIPTILLLNIIDHVTDNVDLVCLLLSCKRLFNFTSSAAVNNNLSFKHLKYMKIEESSSSSHSSTDNDNNIDAYYAQKCYHLNSFKRMFNNTFSDTMIIKEEEEEENNKNNNIVNNNNKNNNITKVIVSEKLSLDKLSALSLPQSTVSLDIYRRIDKLLPSTFPRQLNDLTLHYGTKETTKKVVLHEQRVFPDSLKSLTLNTSNIGIEFSDKALPTGLEKLELKSGSKFDPRRLGLDSLTSLTCLKTGVVDDDKGATYCALPNSLEQLEIRIPKIPSPTYFNQLVQLVHLNLSLIIVSESDVLYLDSLVSLEKLELMVIHAVDAPHIRLAPNLTALNLVCSKPATNLTTEFFPPTLTSLEMAFSEIDFRNVSLPQLTFLLIETYSDIPHASFIPPTVKTLKIRVFTSETIAKGLKIDGSFPNSIETLELSSYHVTGINKLPNSVKKLVFYDLVVSKDLKDTTPPINLPNNLEEFTWSHKYGSELPPLLHFIYPPNIKYIDYSQLQQQHTSQQTIPPTVNEFKYLVSKTNWIDETTQVHSIGDEPGLIIPSTLQKLSITINDHEDENDYWIFQLNHLINHSNVQQLNIKQFNFQVDIRRLDAENRNK
ncbi:hypothetical protein DFA_02049 [Cavenderia fasciculata]|uniref:Uncharacterized protein n=1 Tax=Cavenderia fasciculata TaxID=261658 RepID=F4PYJ7_CACFS|nr:uncharacterized protein DFA_02049 [Cavenderia fasciculata]EGG19263.1 hypothetical protein DFA_02049 [Cavenderia fasciculata]|eukprot:XP_004357534.1 hypothetical protein DFA_02049 [Cavenderia fasciculata]